MLVLALAIPALAQDPTMLALYHKRARDIFAVSNIKDYEMSERGSDYSASEIDTHHGWAVHAMQWKQHHAQVWWADLAVARQNAPGFPDCSDVPLLEQLESTAAPVVFRDISGVAVDPPGDWMCTSTSDPATAAIYAALVMHYWKSPVYVPWEGDDSAYGGFSYNLDAVWQLLRFNFLGHVDLHDYCGLSPADPPSAVLAAVQGGQCATTGIPLVTAEISAWSDLFLCNCPQQFYFEDYWVPGAHLLSGYGNSYAQADDLVFDPPGASREDLVALWEASTILARHVLVEGDAGLLIPLSELSGE
jgi:hypothetical protein